MILPNRFIPTIEKLPQNGQLLTRSYI